jgi:hypothetical protein
MRFDVFGRFVLLVERDSDGWRVLELGAAGRRRLFGEMVVPSHVREDEVGELLADLLHEYARPGATVRHLD